MIERIFQTLGKKKEEEWENHSGEEEICNVKFLLSYYCMEQIIFWTSHEIFCKILAFLFNVLWNWIYLGDLVKVLNIVIRLAFTGQGIGPPMSMEVLYIWISGEYLFISLLRIHQWLSIIHSSDFSN